MEEGGARGEVRCGARVQLDRMNIQSCIPARAGQQNVPTVSHPWRPVVGPLSQPTVSPRAAR